MAFLSKFTPEESCSLNTKLCSKQYVVLRHHSLVLFAVMAFCAFVMLQEHGAMVKDRLLGRREGSMDIQFEIGTITPFENICPVEYPPRHATLHDHREHEVQYYNSFYGSFVDGFNHYMDSKYEFPDIMQYHQNYNYAIWDPKLSAAASEAEASAWPTGNADNYLTGPGWVRPHEYEDANVTVLEGNYAGYNSWFPGNFGHFAHDWLPTIALLRHVLPLDTKFILLDNPMTRNFLEFLDKDFHDNRVVWAPHNRVYRITGQLSVHLPVNIPDPIHGCCSGWDPMRQWIAEKHPNKVPENEKHVLFYTRGGNETFHGRVMNPAHEQQILKNIKAKLQQHGKNDKIVVFSGKDEHGKTLSIPQQFSLFRGAHAFIGPHGSGFGGNFLWMDPFASNCDERSDYLEFMPGPETPKVQHALYASYYGNLRKWPLNYHSLLYTTQSTYETTFIDLGDLDEALDAMWGPPPPPKIEEDNNSTTATVVVPKEAASQEIKLVVKVIAG